MANAHGNDFTFHIHYGGTFVRYPKVEYEDGECDIIEEIDYVIFNGYHSLRAYIKHISDRPKNVLYFLVPGHHLPQGLRRLKNSRDWDDFIDAGFLVGEGPIIIYVGHEGVDIHEWFLDNVESVIDGNEDGEGSGGNSSTGQV